jgi:very-short-patch-repair endonuclease
VRSARRLRLWRRGLCAQLVQFARHAQRSSRDPARMDDAGRKMPPLVAGFAPRSVDEAIARLAATQHGVVSRAQLRDLGLGDAAITRVAAGRLHRLHTAVYAVGHTILAPRGRLELCREHGLPQPRINHTIAGIRVDFLFAEQRLVVETDSWRYHRTRTAFEDDRARDAIFARAGYRTLRFTDSHIVHDPAGVAQAIASALAQTTPNAA